MHTVEAVKTLAEWDRYGWNVFTLSDMRKLFPHQSEKTLSESLRRLVRKGLLERVANGVFVNPLSNRNRVGMFERIAAQSAAVNTTISVSNVPFRNGV